MNGREEWMEDKNICVRVSVPKFLVNWIVLHDSLRISFWVTILSSQSRYNASDSSSDGIFLLATSKTAEYCFCRDNPRRFVIAKLGFQDRFMHFQARPERTD
ncbi:hypothetical protein AVEN_6329-1 [Araneus ventricosus]|uniref:Uncharacterized protein n=1 Tax=Araneus ventricosus TaxID=182803 RepID=A0A4Y2S982_ARAVE|nr:hypothetical protein AVEN_6329-1 [Araneus ventricosus]